MILTVTLNPSLDRTVEIGKLERGALIRAAAARLDPGGKGVNVSRALLANGIASCAVVPYGGSEGEQLIALLTAEGLDMATVSIQGRTRSNITLAEPDGTTTKINEPGTPLDGSELALVAQAVLGAAHVADWVVLSGSLPLDMPAKVYPSMCRAFAASGLRVAVDTSGPALQTALKAGPDLVKPNREELAEVTGMRLACLGDVIEAAEKMRASGARTVLASLGADGALLLQHDGIWYGNARAEPRSSVGAGDALLAGFLSAGAHGPEALAAGLAWGAAAVALPGSRMPGPEHINHDTVTIRPPDPLHPLC
ncbi:1-phosphofructokinase [Streptosporangium album]|uniref:1-phosphofructokinase n=1 Tax=Streptosporangium album TaxID=47479 RepID=A0A7W7S5H6_9ACTN|nr:1-phosphofructokinase [Streptosporangium album]MBB4944256.1 1-phosphofructokinase [Streptosporangium album]